MDSFLSEKEKTGQTCLFFVFKSVKQRGDGNFLIDALDCLSEQRCDREIGDLVACGLILGIGHGIEQDQLDEMTNDFSL